MTDRIVRPAEVSTISGKSPATIWRDQKAGKFPPYVKIGEHSNGMRLSVLMDWINSCDTVSTENTRQVAPGCKRGRKPSAKIEVK